MAGDSITLRSMMEFPPGQVEVEVNGERQMYRTLAPLTGGHTWDGELFLDFDFPKRVELRDAIAKGFLAPVEEEVSQGEVQIQMIVRRADGSKESVTCIVDEEDMEAWDEVIALARRRRMEATEHG